MPLLYFVVSMSHSLDPFFPPSLFLVFLFSLFQNPIFSYIFSPTLLFPPLLFSNFCFLFSVFFLYSCFSYFFLSSLPHFSSLCNSFLCVSFDFSSLTSLLIFSPLFFYLLRHFCALSFILSCLPFSPLLFSPSSTIDQVVEMVVE
jgi:hypothetical protein